MLATLADSIWLYFNEKICNSLSLFWDYKKELSVMALDINILIALTSDVHNDSTVGRMKCFVMLSNLVSTTQTWTNL